MAGIQRRDRKAYGEIQKFFRDQLERTGDLGVEMRGEWEGCRRAHVYGDQYRVIWRELPRQRTMPEAPMTRSSPCRS
jgi:hypothetical protein